MVESMIKRVARAQQAACADGRPDWEDIAWAAINAMREPTEAMIEAGVGADYGGTLGNRAVNSFTAMIDAALSEDAQQ